MRDEAGPFGVNAVTLLAGLILVLILVMGGFTLSTSHEGMEQAQPTEPTGAYAVTINEPSVVRNVDGDPAVYDCRLGPVRMVGGPIGRTSPDRTGKPSIGAFQTL